MPAMLRDRRFLAAAVVCALIVALCAAPRASSQAGGQYDLTWNTIDGGGVTFASGGAYQLGGTSGAPDAGVMSGGAYVLGGGFWGAGAISRQVVYLPTARR